MGYLEVANPEHSGRIYCGPTPTRAVAGSRRRPPERIALLAADRRSPPRCYDVMHKLLVQAGEEGYLHIANHVRIPSWWPSGSDT